MCLVQGQLSWTYLQSLKKSPFSLSPHLIPPPMAYAGNTGLSPIPSSFSTPHLTNHQTLLSFIFWTEYCHCHLPTLSPQCLSSVLILTASKWNPCFKLSLPTQFLTTAGMTLLKYKPNHITLSCVKSFRDSQPQHNVYISLYTVSLRNNSHTAKFTHFKYNIQWKDTPCPLAVTLHAPFLWSLEINNLTFHLCICLLGIFTQGESNNIYCFMYLLSLQTFKIHYFSLMLQTSITFKFVLFCLFLFCKFSILLDTSRSWITRSHSLQIF